MNNTGKRDNGAVYRPYSKKHVTTACDDCRRKRCKCNGQLPCATCISARTSCSYSHSDLRRRRKHAVDKVLEHSGGINSQAHATRHEPQAFAAEETKQPQAASETFVLDHQVRNATRSAKYDGYLCKIRRTQPVGVHEMEGKHETMDDKVSRLDEDYARSSGRKLLPKSSSTPTELQVASNGRHVHGQGAHRQSQPRSLWYVKMKGYPVPGYTRTFGNLPFSSSIAANGYPADIQAHQALTLSAPECLVLPLFDIDESPLGRTFTDFQQLARRLIAGGVPSSQVADEGLIDVTLFFRDRRPEDPLNASTWASEMLRSFRGTFSDQLLLACAVCVGNLMRWLLVPTRENYANLPSSVRPTQLQRLKPHPPWVDLMVFPTFRNALIDNPRDWAEPCIRAKWKFLWPSSQDDAVIHQAHTGRTFVTREFAATVDDPQNWIMGRSILEDFPEIEGSEINIA